MLTVERVTSLRVWSLFSSKMRKISPATYYDFKKFLQTSILTRLHGAASNVAKTRESNAMQGREGKGGKKEQGNEGNEKGGMEERKGRIKRGSFFRGETGGRGR